MTMCESPHHPPPGRSLRRTDTIGKSQIADRRGRHRVRSGPARGLNSSSGDALPINRRPVSEPSRGRASAASCSFGHSRKGLSSVPPCCGPLNPCSLAQGRFLVAAAGRSSPSRTGSGLSSRRATASMWRVAAAGTWLHSCPSWLPFPAGSSSTLSSSRVAKTPSRISRCCAPECCNERRPSQR